MIIVIIIKELIDELLTYDFLEGLNDYCEDQVHDEERTKDDLDDGVSNCQPAWCAFVNIVKDYCPVINGKMLHYYEQCIAHMAEVTNTILKLFCSKHVILF